MAEAARLYRVIICMSEDSQKTFKTIYWGDDRSTAVCFEPAIQLPPDESISACMVFAMLDDKVVLSKPKRGWGIVGGHREPGETAEECARREAWEEAAIELGELRLVGQWVTRKQFESEHNRKYTDPGYQLLYMADVVKVDAFHPMLEVSERAFVPLHQISDFHHNFGDFEEVLNFLLELRRSA